MKRRILCFFCVISLCLGLNMAVSATGVISFTAVNITVLPLTSDTMPISSGMQAKLQYVPYTVFDDSSTGAGLGLYSNYSRSSNTVTIYSLYKMLVFDLEKETCRDGDSQMYYPSKAIIRNGRPYVPVGMVCTFFDLTATNRVTDYGTLLRIKNDNTLDDATFIDAADNVLSGRLREYRQSLNPVTPTQPSQPDSATPPSDPQKPPPIVLPETHTASPAYLAIYCKTGVGVDEIVSALDEAGYKALFLLPPETMALQDDLVRRLLGSGHLVGLVATGRSLEESRTQLEEGQRLLGAIAHTRASIILCPEAQRQALEQEGWICWQETASAVTAGEYRADDYARAVIRSIAETNQALYFTFSDGEIIGNSFGELVRLLVAHSFTVAIPLEILL